MTTPTHTTHTHTRMHAPIQLPLLHYLPTTITTGHHLPPPLTILTTTHHHHHHHHHHQQQQQQRYSTSDYRRTDPRQGTIDGQTAYERTDTQPTNQTWIECERADESEGEGQDGGYTPGVAHHHLIVFLLVIVSTTSFLLYPFLFSVLFFLFLFFLF